MNSEREDQARGSGLRLEAVCNSSDSIKFESTEWLNTCKPLMRRDSKQRNSSCESMFCKPLVQM